jgi:photosystem II stability/assembly factor-like uncharacterized protein
MIAVVTTDDGAFAVDLETAELGAWQGELEPEPELVLNLPRLVAAASAGATVLAVVDAKPPLLVSHDAGSTWRQSGRGLPAGRAVAVAPDNPDLAVYAARNRLYVTRDGGVFWTALDVELPEIRGVSL